MWRTTTPAEPLRRSATACWPWETARRPRWLFMPRRPLIAGRDQTGLIAGGAGSDRGRGRRGKDWTRRADVGPGSGAAGESASGCGRRGRVFGPCGPMSGRMFGPGGPMSGGLPDFTVGSRERSSNDEIRLSCPFGGDRRDRGAKKALLLGGFQHDNRLSELVRFLRGGASGGVDEVAEPRAARQAAGAVGVVRGKVQACRTCGRLTRASAPLSDNDRRPGAGTACTASGSECSRFTPK